MWKVEILLSVWIISFQIELRILSQGRRNFTISSPQIQGTKKFLSVLNSACPAAISDLGDQPRGSLSLIKS